MMKKYFTIALLSLGLLIFTACGGDAEGEGVFKDIEKISIVDPDSNASMLATDTSRSLKSFVTYSDGSSALSTTNVIWETDEESVSANFNSIKGSLGLSANYNGPVRITVSSYQFSDTYAMNIDGIASLRTTPANHTVSESTFEVTSHAIFFSGVDINVTDKVVWSTTDAAIATVDSSGVVTVLASGDFNVTATLLGESNSTVVSNP